MKCLLWICVAIAACSAGVLKDPIAGYKEGGRYFYFAGDDGNLHLVDFEEPLDQEFIEIYSRNPANNGYWLFTRSNPDSGQILDFGDESSVTHSNFDFSKVTVFLVHGWKGHGGNPMNKLLIEAFLEDDDVNVIVLDWSALAKRLYLTAKFGTPAVGRALGQFIKWLAELGLSYQRVHLVGFSLGAHLVGNAGRETDGQVRRITALDPASPLWGRSSNRVSASDAQYVEVIHTNTWAFGYSDPCGDADFYPNGFIINISTCSHSLAYKYMASSVKHNQMLANECATMEEVNRNVCKGELNPMGNSDLFKSRSGIFRVNTVENNSY